MRIKEWLLPNDPCKKFGGNEALFHGLQRLDNNAILCVQLKALNSVRKFVRQYGLTPDIVEEILNKSTLIFLQKIESGAYQFQGQAPSTYLIEIARRVALMATRSQKRAHETLEHHHNRHDPDIENYFLRQEATEMVRYLLGQLGSPCKQVISLHHIEGYSDEEVVYQKLTKYSTVDSLKMKRSDCMKKLVQLAQQWKTSINS